MFTYDCSIPKPRGESKEGINNQKKKLVIQNKKKVKKIIPHTSARLFHFEAEKWISEKKMANLKS